MKFVHPEILWALGALAIPVIVHLFNFRKFKKVLFSNVEFLKEIKQETQSKSKLKHLLILASRLLALACIIFAFAQPFIPSPGMTAKPGGNAVSVYIDNSYSMEGENEDGRLLELAKNKAIEIVNAYSPTDKFQLLTSDFEGRHQRLVSREEVIDLIQEVDVSPVSRKISEVASRQRDLLKTSKMDNKRAFILTDLQANISDYSEVANDSTINISIVPNAAPGISNVYIDSVWFETPVRQLNQPEILNLRVRNIGDETRENIPVQLNVNGQQKSVSSATIASNGSAEIQMTFTNTEPGVKHCELVIDDNQITKDDIFYFSFTVSYQIAILEIISANATGNAVSTVFRDDPYFLFTSATEGSIDYGSLSKQNLVILNQLNSISSGLASELEKFVNAGGSVCIVPGAQIDLVSYNDFVLRMSLGQIEGKVLDANKISSVSYDHFLFKNAFEKTTGNIDLPTVSAYYKLNIGTRTTAEPVMMLQSGSPFMISSTVGSGRAYITSVSLLPEESSFTNHAFFPTSMLRMAEFSQPSAQLAYFLGREQAITLRNLNLSGEETFKLSNIQTKQELIPEHRNSGGNTEIFVHTDLTVAGNYSLLWGTNEAAPLSFNYDRTESDTRTTTAEDIQSIISSNNWTNWQVLNGNLETIAAGANALAEGKKFWYTLIVMALIFLAIEVLLIKFWR